MDRIDPQSARAHVTGSVSSVGRILSREFALARSELSENFSRVGTALALLGVGAACAIVALFVLVGAGVAGLVSLGWPVWVSALSVGAGLALVSGVMFAWAIPRLKASALAPTRSLANVRNDLTALKEAVDG